LVNAVVVKGMNAWEHSTKVAVMQRFLAYCTTIIIVMHGYLPFRDHVDIFEIDEVCLNLSKPLPHYFIFYWRNLNTRMQTTALTVNHLGHVLFVITFNKLMFLVEVTDLRNLSVRCIIHICNCLIWLLNLHNNNILPIKTFSKHHS